MPRSYKKLGRLLCSNQTKGLDKIDVPHVTNIRDENAGDPKTWTGPWKMVTHPQDIAKVVKNMNQIQYYQARNTPFGSGPLAAAVGRQGDTIIANAIINGEHPTIAPTLIPETLRILDSPSCHYHQVAQSSRKITADEFTGSYKVAGESTSFSPSGRHIGHYKAYLQDPILVSLHATMMSIPFQVGIVPDCWR